MENELEALLALAESEAAPGETELNEAERFVISAGITEGTTRIGPTTVWVRYKEWAKKPIVWHTFFCQFKKLFKQHRHGSGRFYLLNPDGFDLSPDAYWRMRKMLRDQRERRRREAEKQAQQNAVSGPSEGNEPQK